MKRFGFLIAFICAAGTSSADPILGVWQTAPDDNGDVGHIEVVRCETAFCGTLVRAYDGAGQQVEGPMVGRAIIWDMQALGGGSYGRGKIYSPDRDQTYNSRITLNGDSLSVEGCVLGICRDGGTWRRVN